MKIGTDGVLIGAWAEAGTDASAALDVGAGCGLISLMLAQRFRNLRVDAVEIDASAAGDCRHNFEASPFCDRVSVINEDFAKFNSLDRYDLIVSNPPFFTTGELSPEKNRAEARHEGNLSCASLISASARMLENGGNLSFIAPAEREDDLIFTAELSGLKLWRLCRVIPVERKAPKRIMMELRKEDTLTPEFSELTIRDRNNSYTPEYISLTKEFYLNF